MSNIIGIGGKMGSGKLMVAEIFEKYGYERLYFAKPLKQIIANLIGGTIDVVNKLKEGEENWQYIMSDNDVLKFAQEAKIEYDIIKDKLCGKVFKNTREMMQILGTDILREYNPNWHVDQIKSMIDKNKKYVIDDVRFPNEIQTIKELGGDTWYVARPRIDNLSTHISENAVTWHDFDNIIVNNNSLEYLQMICTSFIKNDYAFSMQKRKEEIENLKKNEQYLNDYINSKNAIVTLDFLLISKDYFTYTDIYSQDKNVDINNIDISNITNALEIEDLKWHLIQKENEILKNSKIE